MVGIVIVSHSNALAKGIKEIAIQMAPDAKVSVAGGTKDNSIGTDIEKITESIMEVYSEDGVLILFDLGSAYMNTEMAIEFLEDDKKENISIIDAALVEGAITAIVDSYIGKSIDEIKKSLLKMKLNKIQ